MPDVERWAGFFDAGAVIARLGCADRPGDVAEFGCGYGTFALPVASRLAGVVHGFDIEPTMVAGLGERTRAAGIGNLRAWQRDFVAEGTGLADGSMIHAMLFNILHIEDPVGLLREARRVLGPGGSASVIHWRSDIATPRGPSPAIRPSPEQCIRWAEEAGFSSVQTVDLGTAAPWHFGLRLSR